jgi:hypothetical protein
MWVNSPLAQAVSMSVMLARGSRVMCSAIRRRRDS